MTALNPYGRPIIRWLASLGSVWLMTSACVSTSDVKAMQRIKKVAIIGFSATAKSNDPSLKYIIRARHTGEALYALVGVRLRQQKKWDVLPANAVRRNDEYKAFYKKYTSHLLTAGIRASGVLAPIESFNLSTKNRRTLLKALGVDALVEVGFIIAKNEVASRVGADLAMASAHISLDVYIRAKDDSIWHVASLPTRTQLPLPAAFASSCKMPEERALAIAVNSAMTAVFEDKDAAATKAGPPS